jgi:hypothetical protein
VQISKQTRRSEPERSEYQSGTTTHNGIQLSTTDNDNQLSPGADAQRYAATSASGALEAMADFDHPGELFSDDMDSFSDNGANYDPELEHAESHASLSETESLELDPQIVSNDDLRDYLEWLFGDSWTDQMLIIGKQFTFSSFAHTICSLFGMLLKSKTLSAKMTSIKSKDSPSAFTIISLAAVTMQCASCTIENWTFILNTSCSAVWNIFLVSNQFSSIVVSTRV